MEKWRYTEEEKNQLEKERRLIEWAISNMDVDQSLPEFLKDQRQRWNIFRKSLREPIDVSRLNKPMSRKPY